MYVTPFHSTLIMRTRKMASLKEPWASTPCRLHFASSSVKLSVFLKCHILEFQNQKKAFWIVDLSMNSADSTFVLRSVTILVVQEDYICLFRFLYLRMIHSSIPELRTLLSLWDCIYVKIMKDNQLCFEAVLQSCWTGCLHFCAICLRVSVFLRPVLWKSCVKIVKDNQLRYVSKC